MIRIMMLGRTGNNLFQYAVGRVLAERHGVPLVMDGSWFNRAGWRSVSQLRSLPLKAWLIRDPTPASRLLRKLTGRHRWDFLSAPHYREKEEDTSFDPAVLVLPSHCVLHGYFQSPRYFDTMEPMLRKEIQFQDRKLDDESTEWAQKICGSESVAVHVRRTDYIGKLNFDLCGEVYYDAAIARMRQLSGSPIFFVFSDDADWCRTRFDRPGFHVVDCQSSRHDPLNDLHLMSLASHHIIANSSYSWWGAWIGKKPGQRVLMPDVWFKGIHSPIKEKQCDDWELVPCEYTLP